MWKSVAMFLLLAFSPSAFGQQSTLHSRASLPQAPYTDQEIALLFAGQSAADRILLTLNNNRPLPLDARLTIYFLDGSSHKIPAVNLIASESKLIDLSSFLRDQGLLGQVGYAKVSYSGRLMELGAQLTLYPTAGRGGLDSPRSLSVDFADNNREAVTWVPEKSSTVLALTNVSETDLRVRLAVDGESRELLLKPHTTELERKSAATGSPFSQHVYTLSATYEGLKMPSVSSVTSKTTKPAVCPSGSTIRKQQQQR